MQQKQKQYKEKSLKKKTEQKSLLIQRQQGWKQDTVIAPQDDGCKQQQLHNY